MYREIAAYAKAHHPDKRLINTLPLKVYQLIYRLAVYFNPRVIAFAGDDNGVLSLSIKKAVPDAILTDVNRLSGYNSPDWVMIDASRGDIIHAFNDCLQYIQSQTIMLFFNIHRKMEIEAAWKVVKTNKRVMLSIDLFYIGLVFFKENRKEQEHFAIKY
ncbi:hypothetical protein [Mucilaginibacter oryzae]|uniref:hypothetical protein n=1 Tax=Mucilaginibacter oryzae TaxID=468058 RepID=UPI0011B27A5E|nr:hypothetical protein [Mucilaginibacter oryzae]